MAKKVEANFLSDWNDAIGRMAASTAERRDETLRVLTEQTKKLQPRDLGTDALLDTYVLAEQRSHHFDRKFAFQYALAAKKLREEIVRRIEGK